MTGRSLSMRALLGGALRLPPIRNEPRVGAIVRRTGGRCWERWCPSSASKSGRIQVGLRQLENLNFEVQYDQFAGFELYSEVVPAS
jgi:hypothetical protein